MCTRSAIAQIYDREFKPFKIDVSAGYAIPQTSGAKGGLLFAMEPKYAFTGDQFSFGLRLEAAILTPAEDSADISTQQSQANISGLLTADYYFNNNNLRPFLGAGCGLYSMVNQTGKANEGDLLPTATFSNRLGFMLRGGFEWGHLRTGLRNRRRVPGPVCRPGVYVPDSERSLGRPPAAVQSVGGSRHNPAVPGGNVERSRSRDVYVILRLGCFHSSRAS